MKDATLEAVERLIRTRDYFLQSTYQLRLYLKTQYKQSDKQELLLQTERIKLLLLDADFLSKEQSKSIRYVPALREHVAQIEKTNVAIKSIDHVWIRIWRNRRKSYISKCHMVIEALSCNEIRCLHDGMLNLRIEGLRGIDHALIDYQLSDQSISFSGPILGITPFLSHKSRTYGTDYLVNAISSFNTSLRKWIPKQIRLSKVHFSAIAPASMRRGEKTILNVVMYEEEYRSIVERIKENYGGNLQESESGVLLIEEKTEVKIVVESYEDGICFDSMEDRGIWVGKYLQFQFVMHIPPSYEEQCVTLKLAVYFHDIRSTTLKLIVRCDSEDAQHILPERHDIMSAFVSYARQDMEEVSLLVNGMEKVRPDLNIFMDVDSLRSGENWKEKLQQELQQRDILYLCWSSSAKRSKWVDFEWRYIYQNRGSEFVDPIPLESPEFCPPPMELEDKHFNDRWIKYRKRYANEFIRIKDCENGEISVFHKRTVIVGRTSDADFQIKSSSVSSNHLKITSISDNSFFVRDMNSETGSYVSETKLAIQSVGTIVDRGTEIVVGDRTIQIL